MTIIVMLSQPTPPVSLLEAKQSSIKFSQMRWSSCLAAIPRRTNSITACEDWQSQIPVFSSASVLNLPRAGKPTVTCNNEELVVGSDVVDNDIGEGGNDLLLRRKVGALLEFEIANGS